jgi:hypothetical protein
MCRLRRRVAREPDWPDLRASTAARSERRSDGRSGPPLPADGGGDSTIADGSKAPELRGFRRSRRLAVAAGTSIGAPSAPPEPDRGSTPWSDRPTRRPGSRSPRSPFRRPAQDRPVCAWQRRGRPPAGGHARPGSTARSAMRSRRSVRLVCRCGHGRLSSSRSQTRTRDDDDGRRRDEDGRDPPGLAAPRGGRRGGPSRGIRRCAAPRAGWTRPARWRRASPACR